MCGVHALGECRRLLLMAAAVHGLGPQASLRYATSAKVIRQAMHWAGLMNGAVLASWTTYGSPHEERCAAIEEYYGALIGMMARQEEPAASAAYFEGAGYFGGAGNPPNAPHFTSCRLTEAGAALAERLLEQEPGRRTDVLRLQCW